MSRANAIASIILIYDIIASCLAYGLALLMRFDFSFSHIPGGYFNGWLHFLPAFCAVCIITFVATGMYRSVWRYASYQELYRVLIACLITMVCLIIGTNIMMQGQEVFDGYNAMPRSYYVMGEIIQFIALAGARISYRAARRAMAYMGNRKMEGRKRTLIVGSGDAALILLREYKTQPNRMPRIIGMVDDNPNRRGKIIQGYRVLGTLEDIPSIVEQRAVDRIIIAIPSASAERRSEIINICKTTGAEIAILPQIASMVNGTFKLSDIREVTVEELLGREPIKMDMTRMRDYFAGKVVMITGGGGSIGSELCRQIASYGPSKLIVFEIYENGVYDLQQELKKKNPYLNLEVLIGSVRDEARVREVISKHEPDLICHAAAHKHVPLMEDSPNEAIKNNVFGTYNVARIAADLKVPNFLLISTDKAVNPTNIMGASKRLCELVIQAMQDSTSDTNYSIVRFGNVLGSNGSVVPLFRRQIEAGGPVTVTHPDITRFFMTIPEAVSLILQALALGEGGEIFVLDMGSPVKIDDLARNMIYLAGYVPDVDIMVEYTGLRPGEKLYEELLMDEEGLTKTANDLIYVGRPLEIADDFWEKLDILHHACNENSRYIKTMVADLVETYTVDRGDLS